MAKRTSSVETVTWADLWTTLERLTVEAPLHAAGLRIAEITEKVQGQLGIAQRIFRVIELRFTALGVVAYLRTSIPAGKETAPGAGILLVGLRRFDPATGENGFIRYPHIKRTPAWRDELKRCLRAVLDDLETGAAADPRRPVCSLVEFMTGETYTHQPVEFPPSIPVPMSHGHHWDEVKAAGISLPVWLTVAASLGLVMAILR